MIETGFVKFCSVSLWQNDHGVITATRNAPFWQDLAVGIDVAPEFPPEAKFGTHVKPDVKLPKNGEFRRFRSRVALRIPSLVAVLLQIGVQKSASFERLYHASLTTLVSCRDKTPLRSTVTTIGCVGADVKRTRITWTGVPNQVATALEGKPLAARKLSSQNCLTGGTQVSLKKLGNVSTQTATVPPKTPEMDTVPLNACTVPLVIGRQTPVLEQSVVNPSHAGELRQAIPAPSHHNEFCVWQASRQHSLEHH